jgi:hypothetical protein
VARPTFVSVAPYDDGAPAPERGRGFLLSPPTPPSSSSLRNLVRSSVILHASEDDEDEDKEGKNKACVRVGTTAQV